VCLVPTHHAPSLFIVRTSQNHVNLHIDGLNIGLSHHPATHHLRMVFTAYTLALREKPGGKPASPNRNRHTRLTIPVLWHPLGIDCRPPRTAAHRRLLLPTSHFIGQGEGLNKGRQVGVAPRT